MHSKLQGLQFYNLKDVAQILSVTERTLHNYIKDGKLKAQKIGGKWKISDENLNKFINGEN